MAIEFKKAQRQNAYLKIAITGPSGSGKTYGALGLASCWGKKIAVIDTENNSASLYSDKFEFDTLSVEPPYEMKKYIQAIELAVEAGYEVLVIDSLTHAWAGSGGLLDKKSALDSKGGNSFTNWGTITKEHELFLAKLLHSKIHLIGTIRSKQGYSIESNDKGKLVPQKVGFEPIQREGIEYEFTTVFDLGMSHFATVSKDRTDLFDGSAFKLDRRVAGLLHDWIKGTPKVEEKKPEEEKKVETKTTPKLKEQEELFDKEEETEQTIKELSLPELENYVFQDGEFKNLTFKEVDDKHKVKCIELAMKVYRHAIDHKPLKPQHRYFLQFAQARGWIEPIHQ